MARVTSPEWPLLPRETLAARALRATSAEKRIAELESQLESAHEKILRRENEIASLQKLLDQNAGENSRLSRRLEEHSAAADIAKSQSSRLAMALATAEHERDEANQRRQTETSELSTHLEVTLARAIAAEKLLSQAQQDLRVCNTKNSAMERRVADAESAVQEKEHQIHELTRSRSMLIDELNRLRTISKIRDEDLARAKENHSRLAELVVQLETKVKDSKNDKKVEEINPRLQEARQRIGAKSSGNSGRTNCAVLKRDLDKDAWLLGPLRSVNAA